GAKESEHLAILRRSSMPAIIIEGAFMSNPGDLEKIRTAEFKEKYAYALAKGLITAMNQAF
ncbi:MAG TPA: N-acetylmuramoyl-L-alanine amidase, partial [Anaerovoracaceae bacterium]|nr:N-acetylmuramoyl-L-alanine amidase [Anaerovoracaceae bacterium]